MFHRPNSNEANCESNAGGGTKKKQSLRTNTNKQAPCNITKMDAAPLYFFLPSIGILQAFTFRASCLLGLEGGPQLNLVADVCVLRSVEKLVPAGEYLKLKNMHSLLQLDFSELKELHQQARHPTAFLLSGIVVCVSVSLFFWAISRYNHPFFASDT